jgi:hypothetical protein
LGDDGTDNIGADLNAIDLVRKAKVWRWPLEIDLHRPSVSVALKADAIDIRLVA